MVSIFLLIDDVFRQQGSDCVTTPDDAISLEGTFMFLSLKLNH